MNSQPNGLDVTCTTLDGFRTCLTRGDTAGLTMQVAASLLSLGSILYTFAFIVLQNAIRYGSLTGIRIFYYPMDILIFSLLFADGMQAVGGLISIKWVQDGIVEVGPFCDAQGVLKVFGETGVALSTLLIAIYTFAAISTETGLRSMRNTAAIVVSLWLFILILVGIGHATNHKSSFMSPAPYWCWVNQDYLAWRLVSEYLWMWIALFVSLLLYVPLYLWMRGNLVFDEYAWSFQWTCSDSSVTSTRKKALVMLLYPIVYCICIIPLSVVRWVTFMEEAKHGSNTMPSMATFAVIIIFGLSGFLNVILVFTTKPKLGLFGRQELVDPVIT